MSAAVSQTDDKPKSAKAAKDTKEKSASAAAAPEEGKIPSQGIHLQHVRPEKLIGMSDSR